MRRQILVYGLVGGVLIALLKWTEYRFLVVEHSLELYGGLVAAVFAAVGIWLGLKLTRSKETDAGPNLADAFRLVVILSGDFAGHVPFSYFRVTGSRDQAIRFPYLNGLRSPPGAQFVEDPAGMCLHRVLA